MSPTTLSGGFEPPPARVTVADELLFHYISDEEFELLTQEKPDEMMQVFWACVGVFFGSAHGACIAIAHWLEGAPALIDQVPVAFSLGAGPLAVLSFIVARQRKKKILTVQARIRARNKVRASGMVLDHTDEPAA